MFFCPQDDFFFNHIISHKVFDHIISKLHMLWANINPIEIRTFFLYKIYFLSIMLNSQVQTVYQLSVVYHPWSELMLTLQYRLRYIFNLLDQKTNSILFYISWKRKYKANSWLLACCISKYSYCFCPVWLKTLNYIILETPRHRHVVGRGAGRDSSSSIPVVATRHKQHLYPRGILQ